MTYELGREDERLKAQKQLKSDLIDRLASSGLSVDDIGKACELVVDNLIEEYVVFTSNRGDLDNFLFFIKEKGLQGFFLEREITSTLEIDKSPFFSEICADDRFELLESLDPMVETEIQRFSFRLPHEPIVPFMDYDTFLLEHFLPVRESSLNRLPLHEAQILRQGISKYFDKLCPQDVVNEDEDADNEKTLDFLSSFIVHFSNQKEFGEEPILDLKMTKSLQETLAFLQHLNFGESIDDYALAAISVAEPYIKDLRKSQETKYPNHPDKPEAATPFEHFMSVTRIMLGALESLDINSRLLGNDFNKRLRERPNYLQEIVYTALLHDIVEDGRATKAEVEALLVFSGLDADLIGQIMKNIDLLNVTNFKTSDDYVESILQADNPVVLLVKYADIMHNNKSATKKKFNEDGTLSDFWIEKQSAYNRIIQAVANELPVHIRIKEMVDILSANPELLQFSAWKQMLSAHPKKKEILSEMKAETRQAVEAILSA